MNRIGKIAAAACSAWLAACCLALPTGAASTIEDVYAALTDFGYPDSFVQTVKNTYEQSVHDEYGMFITFADGSTEYKTFTEIETGILLNSDKVDEYLAEYVLVSTAPPAALAIGETQTTVSTAQPFSKLKLEEQQAYLASLSEADRAAFLQSLTPEQRKSILKQLSMTDKTAVFEILKSLGEDIGAYVTVDSVEGNNINYSVRDGNGDLIASEVLGMAVDDTGWDLTIPVLGACGSILLACAGFFGNLRAGKRRETA